MKVVGHDGIGHDLHTREFRELAHQIPELSFLRVIEEKFPTVHRGKDVVMGSALTKDSLFSHANF